MSSSKRKVTLDKTSGDSGDKSKPSVFDRLGPNLSADSEVRVCMDFLLYRLLNCLEFHTYKPYFDFEIKCSFHFSGTSV
jgi:hypothetical protein